jgi:hypothetical protein
LLVRLACPPREFVSVAVSRPEPHRHCRDGTPRVLGSNELPVIVFACKCGDPDSHRTVPLAASAYKELRSDGEPVLSNGCCGRASLARGTEP